MKVDFKRIAAVITMTAMCAVPMVSSVSANAFDLTAGRKISGGTVAFGPGYGCGNEPHVPVVTGVEPSNGIPIVTRVNPIAEMTCTVTKTVTCFSHTCSVTKTVTCGKEKDIYRGIKTTSTRAF